MISLCDFNFDPYPIPALSMRVCILLRDTSVLLS
jgi:hypothetical protein